MVNAIQPHRILKLMSSPGESRSGEDSDRVYLAALLDFIGLHDESVRVLRDAPDAMSRNMEGMLAAAHGRHTRARDLLMEALDAAADSRCCVSRSWPTWRR